ncbi:MAG: O-antigen ligase family protein [Anaerolineae bacterium]|nr:O-antigen ligase family protein [Gloeobacterales cyanobacterium ES-bin-313]
MALLTKGQLELLFLAVCYTALLILRNSYTEITQWPWCLLPQGFLLVGSFLALRQWRSLGQPFDILVGFTLVGMVGTAWLSPDPMRSWWYLTMIGGYFGVLYGVAGTIQESLLPFLSCSQAVLCVASLNQYGQEVALPQWRAGGGLIGMNNVYPLGHHNFVSGFLALTVPITLFLLIQRRGWQRLGWLLIFALGCLTLYTTQSRGGWAGVALGCAVTFLIVVPLNRRTLFGLTVTAVVVGVVGWTSITTSNNKSQMLLQGRDISAEQRFVYWQTGVALWRDHPFFGVGQGVTGYIFPRYRTDISPWMSRTAQQLHSTPFHLLAETGAWGLIAYFAWIGTCTYLLWKLRNYPEIAALAGGLAGYGVSSLTDFQLENPAISITLVLMVAELVRMNGSSRPSPRPLAAFGLLLFVTVAVGWIRIDQAWWESTLAFRHLGDYALFHQHIVKAESLDPTQPYYPLQRAQKALDESRAHPETRLALLAEASQAADRAIRILPTDPLTLTNGGWLHFYRRDYQGAAAIFQRAVANDPSTTAKAQLGMGLSLMAQNMPKAALLHLLREILYFPDTWWDERWESETLKPYKPQLAKQALAYYDNLLTRYPGDLDFLYQQAMLLMWIGQDAKALQKLDSASQTQIFLPDQPVAIRLPWRALPSYVLGLRVQLLHHLGRSLEVQSTLAVLKKTDSTISTCVESALAHPQELHERTFLANGQDYFLLRRIGGQTISYFEPLHAKTWEAMDCLHFGQDGRNGRLPL